MDRAEKPLISPWPVFRTAVWVWIGYNVVVSLLGWLIQLPDLPNTHARNLDITLDQVVFSNGTIVSPPLFFMVIAGLLLWGAATSRVWLSATCTVLLIVSMVFTASDEYGGDGGLTAQPTLYSDARWHLALVFGWLFIAISAVVALAGIYRLVLRFKRGQAPILAHP
jgi:hypothetical protein